MHKGIMGNLLQCCQTMTNYFKCEETSARGGAERSPLLSSEESECESPSLQDDPSAGGVTNPALEPEHLLFPDIILSSNLGGEMTLVEPMVCLLVSEEEDGVKVEELDGEGREGRSYSEVETQTEEGEQRCAGVQTQPEAQIEIQDHTEAKLRHNETLAREGDTQTRTGSDDLHCDRGEVVQEEGKTEMNHAEIYTEKNIKDAEKDILEEISPTLLQTEGDTESTKEVNPNEDSLFLQQSSLVAKESTASAFVEKPTLCAQDNMKEGEHLKSRVNKHEDVINESHNNSKDADRLEDCPVDLKQKDTQNTNHTNIHLSENHTNQAFSNTDSVQCQENQHPPDSGEVEEDNRADLEEERTLKKQMTLFSVDKLFLTATKVRASPTMEKSPEKSDEDDRKQLSVRDIVSLQETGFTVTIQPPAAESFELQVSGQMLVAELHQVLMDHELTCHRTCFSLQLGGGTLDSLTQLTSILQEGALIKVVEESYSVRDARLHLRHVRDLLGSLNPTDANNGVNCSSLSYLSCYTRGDKDDDILGNKRNSECADLKPPEHILPGCKDRPLSPLQPIRDDLKPLQCVRVLTMSSWNPPPGNRKMHGDLMYLNVLTMENKELNITSSTRGFYLNQSTAFNFNPKPAAPKILCHSLVELLSQVSPIFRKNFSALQRKRVQQHPYERIAAPFQVFTWIARHGDHSLDCVRAEETHTSRMGQDEHTAGQSRDWNEELQGCRELNRSSIEERLHRERCMFKTNCDFVATAAQGAVAVVEGNVMPLNPGEPPHMQMFIWNNLFFSLGFDISDHYQPLGGNTAAHAAAVCDLRGAQAYSSVDIAGLHTLGTAVVDYRGIRVIAQTIVPGILEKNQEQSVTYGSNDYGKTVFTNSRFLDLLDKTCKPLRLLSHKVLDHNNSSVQLCSGIETKGILGNDGRAYILDLLRTFPPDLNFQLSETRDRWEVPEVCQSFGFPKQHCHSLASLRPELIEAFVQHRYELFVKMVSEGLKQQDTTTEQNEDADFNLHNGDTDFHRRSVIVKACKAVGSVSESCFDIRFNPDVCSPGVRFPPESAEEVQRQRQLLWDAAAFLLTNQIPAVVSSLPHTQAEGLSRPNSGADGWCISDVCAAPAGC